MHESEFRFVVVVPLSQKGKYSDFTLPLGQLSSYDLEIIANPFMQNWEYENIQKLLNMYGLKAFLKKSKMDIRM